MSPPPEVRSALPGRYRLGLVLLAAVALVLAWRGMTEAARHDPWFDNLDSNIHDTVDALAINSSIAPLRTDQPGLASKYLLALDYRIRHFSGVLPVWNLKKLGGHPDPLQVIPELIQLSRTHARILVLLFILATAGVMYVVTRSLETSLLSLILLAASSGLLFHGVVSRPELLCVWFGTVVAPACAWQATSKGGAGARPAWLFLAGLATGLAALTKLAGGCYLLSLFGWCWVAAWVEENPTAPFPHKSRLAGIILPVASSAVMFWLLFRLELVAGIMADVTIVRLRVAAALAGALPLLLLWTDLRRLGEFLRHRALELAWIIGGVLAAIGLAFGGLRAVMAAPAALTYLARVLELVVHPDPVLQFLMPVSPQLNLELQHFVTELPFLLAGTTVAAWAAMLARPASPRLRALIGLLWFNGIAMTLFVARSGYQEFLGLFAEVPLLLLCPLSLLALGVWRPRAPGSGPHWAVPPVLTGVAVILLTVTLRLDLKCRSARTETAPPLRPQSITFLYNHDVHPERYRQIMSQHYGTQENFNAALRRYLADPANRPDSR